MKIGILAAMDCEAAKVLEALPEIENVKLLTVTSGMGKVNAAMAATELILRESPDYIISAGCAGAMEGSPLRQGDIIAAEKVAFHDVWCGEEVGSGVMQGQPRFFEADPLMLEAAVSSGSVIPSGKVCRGLLVCGDQFYIGPGEEHRILSLYPDALAADMESAAIAQVCRRFGVPFLSLRVISDVHTSAEIQKDSYSNFWDRDLSHYVNVLADTISRIARG